MPSPKTVVVVFDLDETITVIDTLPAFLLVALKHRPSRWLPALTLPFAVLLHRLGFFTNTWLKRLAFRRILTGLSRDTIEQLIHPFVEKLLQQELRPSAKKIIDHHKNAGHHLVLATASFDFYVKPLAGRLGIDTVLCTESHWSNDKLSSQANLSNCYGEEKSNRVNQWIEGLYDDPLVVAYSDSHADLPLLEYAHVGMAVNPTKKLRKVASQLGYTVQDWQNADDTHECIRQIQIAIGKHGT